MPHVFISYHHEDRDQAYVVNGHIKGIPLDTFLDDDRLHAGDNWPEELEHALDAASALVVLCTSKAVNSTEVLFEVSYAMGRGIPVIPLRYEREFQLPRFLARRQYLDWSEASKPWHALCDVLKTSVRASLSIAERARQVGLVDIGSHRTMRDRTGYFLDVLS